MTMGKQELKLLCGCPMLDAYSICNNQEHLFKPMKKPTKKKENWKEDLFKHFGQRRHITKDCDHTLEEWVEEKKKKWEK